MSFYGPLIDRWLGRCNVADHATGGYMMWKASLLIIAFSVVPIAAQASDLSDQVLSVHNAERARVGEAPLTWSDKLSADAKVWADHLAATGKFYHDPQNPYEGENLSAGGKGAFTYTQLTQLWADEKAKFNPGVFPDVSTDGNWANVGHYTQMIWRGTTEVGCAVSTGESFDFLVCRYSTAGNVIGEKVY